MMGCELVKFEEKDGVAALKLLPFDPMNQIARLSEEIAECCRQFRDKDENSVLVITEGIPGLLAIKEESGYLEKGATGIVSLAQPIAACERPVIIGIRGDAVGLGLEMALACDVRVASETSKFAMPQIYAGLVPWDGGTQRLPRTVGKAKALEMILTGERIDAQEANRIGLVSRIVPAEKVITTVMELARDMASKSSVSLEYCKEAIVKGMDLTLEQGLRLEADLYFLMHTTHDREEGIKAFQEKRKSKFKGN
jgi:enoyl-CoA hydratase/carnithine racemase